MIVCPSTRTTISPRARESAALNPVGTTPPGLSTISTVCGRVRCGDLVDDVAGRVVGHAVGDQHLHALGRVVLASTAPRLRAMNAPSLRMGMITVTVGRVSVASGENGEAPVDPEA